MKEQRGSGKTLLEGHKHARPTAEEEQKDKGLDRGGEGLDGERRAWTGEKEGNFDRRIN